MVNAVGSAVLALLASSAAAQHHQHRHHHARRGDAGSYPVASYPVASYPVASNSSTAAAAATAYSYSVGSPAAPAATSTTTHTLTSTSTDVIYQTMTIEPLPVAPESKTYAATSPAAQSGAMFSAAPVATLEYCAPVTVTITVHASHAAPEATSTSPASSPVYSKAPVPVKASYALSSSSPAAAAFYEISSTYEASSYAVASSYHVSPSPSPSPSPTPSSTPAPASGSKRGLAYTDASALSGFHSYVSSISWAWNWNSQSSGLNSGFEYVPIINNLAQASSFHADVQSAVSSGAKYVMGLNEPDMTTGGGGSALSPQDAASAYMTYVQPFAGSGVKLGSVSVTSNNAATGNQNGVSPSSGLAYLAEWKQACSGCQVDFVQLHWYGAAGQSGADQAATFNQYVDSACAQVEQIFGPGTKVWFTEFSALPTLADDTGSVNTDFMAVALPYLDSHPSVERYSYFSASPSLLVNADGSLTKAGQAYTS